MKKVKRILVFLWLLVTIVLSHSVIVYANATPTPAVAWFTIDYQTIRWHRLDGIQLIGCDTTSCNQPVLLQQYGTLILLVIFPHLCNRVTGLALWNAWGIGAEKDQFVLVKISLLAFAILVGACTRQDTRSPQLDQIILLDVQGLWGGRDLWILDDGTAYCRIVVPPEAGESGLQEKRYRFNIPQEDIDRLVELIQSHEFFSIQTEDRLGVPDKARPIIYVAAGDRTAVVAKWANDRHPDFDPIYEVLVELAEVGENGELVWSGSLDWEWRPDQFPDNGKIYSLVSPN
ncbi:MAG: hypothetical protein GY847_17770 [Proteobacteria bacterium]|nr:hypothetical protein [Pseudomonadota bacterium]